jgi:hypothetical protein
LGLAVTWQDAAVVLIVGAAVAFIVRKFLLPARPRSKPSAFISIQQLKSRNQTKPQR